MWLPGYAAPLICLENGPFGVDKPLGALEGMIQAIESRIAPLELCENAQRLRVMVKTAIGRHELVEHVFAGVAKGGVT